MLELTSARTSLRLLVGVVDFDTTTLKLLLIECGNCVLGLLFRSEGDEAEASGTASVTVAHHNGLT